QENGWMDERGCQIWFNKVWKPYAASYPSSLLLLDEFKCHIQSSFIQTLNSIGTELEIIPGGYTCVLQPCDVGINKPLKDGIRAQYNAWAVRKMDKLAANAKVPTPELYVIAWLVSSWDAITSDTIAKTITSIGYGVEPRSEEPNLPVVIESTSGSTETEDDYEVELQDLVLGPTI
ncbi:Pogo transposable element, partial [Phytophthora megakarya]